MSTDLVKKTLTIPEVAAELGIGRSLAYALAAQGKIPVLRLGNRLVVPKERFIAWLEVAPVENMGKTNQVAGNSSRGLG